MPGVVEHEAGDPALPGGLEVPREPAEDVRRQVLIEIRVREQFHLRVGDDQRRVDHIQHPLPAPPRGAALVEHRVLQVHEPLGEDVRRHAEDGEPLGERLAAHLLVHPDDGLAPAQEVGDRSREYPRLAALLHPVPGLKVPADDQVRHEHLGLFHAAAHDLAQVDEAEERSVVIRLVVRVGLEVDLREPREPGE